VRLCASTPGGSAVSDSTVIPVIRLQFTSVGIGKCFNGRLMRPPAEMSAPVQGDTLCQFVLDVVHDVAVGGFDGAASMIWKRSAHSRGACMILASTIVKFHPREEVTDAGEQRALVRTVDQHLQAFAGPAQSCLDDRRRANDLNASCRRMPGDLLWFVVEEIALVERAHSNW